MRALFLFVALLVGGAALSGQGAVVSLERGSALKSTFPFVRFSTLASFEVPLADGFTHAARTLASSGRESLVIPPDVLALHGKPASVRGFMLPIEVNADGVKSFILTSSIDSCHWGMIGLPNEWVLVELADGRRVPFLQFQPVTVFGRLRVEPLWRGERLAGLYQIRAEFLAADGL